MPLRFAAGSSQSYAYPLLLGQFLPETNDAAQQSEIVYRDEYRGDYAGLRSRVGRLATTLASCGVEQGTVVAMMDWDSHRYLEAYFAVPMMGAVLQTVNVRLSVEQIAYTLAQTGAEVLVFHLDFAPLVESLSHRLPALRQRILIADGVPEPGIEGIMGEYEELLDRNCANFDFEEFDENAIATTFHTTGTTGLPKAVSFSHRQLVLHTIAVGMAVANQPIGQGARRGDVYMPLTPMFHVHAWGMPYIATLLRLKQVYPGRYEPGALLALQAREGVTFSHCVPTILQMLLAALPVGGQVSGDWTMLIGGAPMHEDLRLAAKAAGISAVSGYGMSETGPVISMARAENREAEVAGARTRAGYPVPLVKTRIAELGGASGQGELLLRAPWLTQGYSGQEEASEALWHGGWLRTQDVARMTTAGEIEIVDRMKDVIKTGGEWLSSAQLEDLVIQHPRIAEAAFIGIPDPRWGERPFAVLVLKDPEAIFAIETLRMHLGAFAAAGVISRYAVPDRMLVLSALPRTSVGKIDKKALRLLAENAATKLPSGAPDQ